MDSALNNLSPLGDLSFCFLSLQYYVTPGKTDPLHHLKTSEMHFHFLVTFSHLSLPDFYVFYMQ